MIKKYSIGRHVVLTVNNYAAVISGHSFGIELYIAEGGDDPLEQYKFMLSINFGSLNACIKLWEIGEEW